MSTALVSRVRLPLHTLALSFAALLAGSCGGGDSTGTPAPVATVTISPDPASVQVGATVQLTAALEDASGNALSGRTVTWSSGAEGVATVAGSGVVTGVSVGSATITATSEGKSGSGDVSVTSASSGPLLGPGESGVLFTVIDPGSPSVQNVGTPRRLRRPDTQSRFLGMVNWQAYKLGLVPEHILVPAGALGSSIIIPSGSVIGSRGTGGSGGSRIAPITSSVLFSGGYLDATSIDANPLAVLYRPATNQATELTMTAARIYHTSTPLSGSRVLLAGGFDGDEVLSSAEIFTESLESFAAIGAMGVARGRHAAAVLPDGRVLITGGLIPEGAGPVTIDTKTTEIFDPASGTFAPGPDMGVARFNHSALSLNDGRVLVLGGNHLSSAEVYDPTANTFNPVGAMHGVHGLGHRAVKLVDGKVLVLGGDQGTIQPSEVAELFDPATDQFTQVGDMTTKRMLHFAVVNANDGRVLVGGGQDETGELLASAEVYDPVAMTFSPAVDLQAGDSEQAAVFVQQ